MVWVRSSLVCVGVVGACALATVLVHFAALQNLNREREAPQSAWERYPLLLSFNDTPDFQAHLQNTAEGLRQGKLIFPISDYDCPVSFLLPAGALVAFADMSPLVAMNHFAVFVNFLAGLAAFGFIRALGANTLPALIAAMAYQTANYAAYFPFMGHLHCAQLQWLPLALWSLLTVVQTGRLWAAMALGCVMGLQVISSPYYTLYLSYFALPTFGAVYWFHTKPHRPSLAKLAVCSAVAVVLALTIAAVYLLPRLGQLPKTYPLDPENGFHLTNPRCFLDPKHPVLFLGVTGVLGIAAVLTWRKNRTPAFAATTAALTVLALMILPGVVGSPYWAAYQVLPLLDRIRAPIRLAPLLNLLLLACLAVALAQLSPRWQRVGVVGFALAVLSNWLLSPW